jgi:hypothetical protein
MFSVLKHARIPLFSNRKSNHIFTIWQHYSEYFIGHSGSTYWRKKDSEKAEISRKIEPYLTFLNVHQLERQGADIQTKVEELEELNQSLRQRDKVKDDAIAQLSDQLVSLSARLQEIERRQITA